MAAERSLAEQSFIEKDLCTMFSPDFLRKPAAETGLIKRERKIDAVIIFWVLVLSFGVRLQRSLARCNLGDLDTFPSRLRLFSSWMYSPSNIFRQLPPGSKHCFRIAIISVARYCRRFNWISAIFCLQHHSHCNFLIILSYRASHSSLVSTSIAVPRKNVPRSSSSGWLLFPLYVLHGSTSRRAELGLDGS